MYGFDSGKWKGKPKKERVSKMDVGAFYCLVEFVELNDA